MIIKLPRNKLAKFYNGTKIIKGVIIEVTETHYLINRKDFKYTIPKEDILDITDEYKMPYNRYIITKHALQRASERLGINKKDSKDFFKKMFKGVSKLSKNETEEFRHIVKHGKNNTIYYSNEVDCYFVVDNHNNTIVTLWGRK